MVPLATLLAAVLVDLLPFASLGPNAVTPSILLVAAYYWTLHRPDLVSSLDLFTLGFAIDLVAGTPLGITSLLLLCVRRMVLAPQRPALVRSFLAGWLGFLVVAATIAALAWAVSALVHGSVFPLGLLAVETALTVAIYPPLAAALSAIARALPREPDAAEG
jgi:rod shape-determining protein MreD